ncbi:uncharacterized protein [Dermacentor albipictus]|uniref:uncharacterized protein isoform X1 n=1 Tax=Dermacentor albipictus TaxID=60249 RepID=UPI0031FC9E26
MAKKDPEAIWYYFETKDSIRVMMVLYGFITFLAMVSEATSTVVTARNTDYHRRPHIWIMGTTYTLLRFLTLIVIMYWIAAASKTSIHGMRIGFNIIFVRVIGTLLYTVGYFVTETFLIPDTLSRRYRMIIHPDIIPKETTLITVLAWTVVECVMLDRMNHYELYTAYQRSAASPKSSRLPSPQVMSPTAAVLSPTGVLSPRAQQLRSAKASRATTPAVLSPTTPRRPAHGQVSRVASPTTPAYPRKPRAVLSPTRPRGTVAPSRVGSPTQGYAFAYRPAGSVAPSRAASPTVAYAPAK